MSPSIIYLGLDVHKDSITLAVLPADAPVPTRVDRLPNDLPKLKRYLARLVGEGTLRICYEASGAGFVLHRSLRGWGYHCAVIAPSLIPTKPGVQRKHDRYDAIQLARLYRAGVLPPVRVPSEVEERIRDLVRCRETLQRELLKSRHYLLTFLARRGRVFRAGKHWTQAHLAWLRTHAGPASPLEAEDVEVRNEYLALFDYQLGRRQALDQRVAALAETPSLRTAVQWLQCFRGFPVQGAMVLQTELGDWHRFDSPRPLMAYWGLVPREDSNRPAGTQGVDHQSGECALSPCADPGGVELPTSAQDQRGAQDPTAGPAGHRAQPRVASPTALTSALPPPRLPQATPHRRGRGGARTRRLSLGRDAGTRAAGDHSGVTRERRAMAEGCPRQRRWSILAGRYAVRRSQTAPVCLEGDSSRRIHFVPLRRGDALTGE